MSNDLHRRQLLGSTIGGAIGLTLPGAVWAQATAPMPPAPTPQQWAKAPAVQQVSLSPSGLHVAYLTETGGQKTLYDVDLGANVTRTFNIGKAKISDLFWVDDTHIVVVSMVADKLTGIAGGIQTYNIATVFNLAEAKTNILFQRVDYFNGLTAGNVQRITWKGEAQITAASYRMDEDESKYLYRFSPDSDRPWAMDRGPWGTLKWVVSPEGELIARTVYDKQTRKWLLDYYTKGSWKTIHSQSSDLDWPTVSGLSRDGRSLVVYMPGDTDNDGNYYEMSPDGTLSPPLIDSAFKTSPLFDPVTLRLAGFASYRNGWPQYRFDDPAKQVIANKVKSAFSDYHVLISARSDDPNRLIAYSEGVDDAGTYYYLDFTAKKVLEVGVNYPEIPPEWITTKQAIKYKAGDGLEIEAFLTLPPNKAAKNLPLIVYPHGGPQAYDDGSFDSQVQTYASRGYAVLQPNYRGSAGYGHEFVTRGHGQWGKKMQTDLSDGVRFLAAQGLVDPKRVSIVGASYGGYAALAGAAFDPGVYRCAVDIAGISDLKSWQESVVAEEAGVRGYRSQYWREFLGNGDWDSVSPARNAGKIDIPVLIIHGKDDSVVPYSQSERMYNALKAAGKDVQFLPFKGQDHWETDEASRIEMMTYIVAFLDKHNPA